MSQQKKGSRDRKDKSLKNYYARCLRTLKEWGAPTTGWCCIEVIDIREDDEEDYETPLFTCELCGCSKVRYVHVMDNDLYFETVRVGCICAGCMEDDIFGAKERERLMRNRSKRRKNFLKRKWDEKGKGVWERSYKNQELMILEHSGSFSVHVGSKVTLKYKGRPINNLLSAMYAAFDLADPVEEIFVYEGETDRTKTREGRKGSGRHVPQAGMPGN